MIIAVANMKGGVGKSTLAVHLAAWLDTQGHRVTLADCDHQQSSSQWVREAAPRIKALCLHDPDAIYEELPRIARETDYVIADGPGSMAEISRALLFVADAALIPCKASLLEARALEAATRALRHVQSVRAGAPDARIVLSMVGRTYRLTQDMKDAAALLKLPIAATPLSLRQSYADAPGQAAVVWHMGAKAREAADEIHRLFHELLPDAVREKDADDIKTGRRRAATYKL